MTAEEMKNVGNYVLVMENKQAAAALVLKLIKNRLGELSFWDLKEILQMGKQEVLWVWKISLAQHYY